LSVTGEKQDGFLELPDTLEPVSLEVKKIHRNKTVQSHHLPKKYPVIRIIKRENQKH